MSIVRMGLGEQKGFAEGYEAIFGKRTKEAAADPAPKEADSRSEPAPRSETTTPPADAKPATP